MSSPGGAGGWGSGGWGSNPYGPGESGQPPRSAYQGFGVFDDGRQAEWGQPESSGRPPRREKWPMITLACFAVVLLLAGVTTVVVLNWTRSTPQAAPAPAPAATGFPTTSSPTSSSPASRGSSTTGDPSDQQTFIAPVIPGWRGVSWPAYGIAYDIPPSWQPKPRTSLGVGDDTTARHVIVSAASLYMENYCRSSQSSYRAIAGAASSPDKDPAAAAKRLIDNWADYGFTAPSGVAPKVTKTTPQQVTLAGNQKATLASATITPATGVPCGAPHEAVSVAALPGPNGSAMLIALGDEGVPGAVSPTDLQRIVTSLRLTR